MLCRIAGHFPQIGEYASGQEVGADKVRRTVMGAFLVVAADITVLLALVRLVSLLIHHAAAVRTEQYAGEQTHFIIAVWAFALFAKLLHPFPCLGVYDVCSAMERPVLKAGDQPQSTMWGHMLVAFKNSQYQQQAAELAKTLVSDDVALDYFENNGMPPVTKSAENTDEVKNDAYLQGFLKATSTARMEETARMTNASEIKSVITEELQFALLGQKTAEQAVADMASRLEAL